MNRIKGNGDRAAERKQWLCAQESRQSSTAQASPRVLLSLLLLLFTALFAEAAAPQWWSERGVIDPQASANDYAAINQGQLKNLAIKAHAELRQRLPASVWTTTQGMALDDFIATLQTTTNSQFNYSAVNIGQLKNVARPFYDVLMLPSVRFATAYPWANATTPANDFAMANIGQAKNLFSFEFSTFDADGNGISDIWEMQYFGRAGISTTADPDRDNVSNLQEFQNGSSPIDYYNGVIPTVVITGGDGQRSSASVVLTTPLKVKVAKADTSVWANAPVSFTVLSGGGSVALTTSSVPVSATSYTLLTDANGEAQIYFRQPAQAGVISYIQATVGGAAPVVFTEYSSTEAGYWKLDETSGTTAADASTAGNQATLHGTPTWLPTGGMINGALQLSGENDYACLSSAAPLDITGDLSIAVWIKVNASTARYMRIVSKKEAWDSAGGYEIEYNPSLKRLCFAGQGREQLLAYGTDLNSGWHYIVATLQKKSNSSNYEPRIYIDGVEKIKSTTISATQSGVYITNHSSAYAFKTDQSFSPLTSSAASLAIGRNGQIPGQSTANGSDYFTGCVDDVRIYDHALTADEITKLASDADGDGIADAWELQWLGSISVSNASSDSDGDGISDSREYILGTNPTVANADKDKDGVPDSYEETGGLTSHSMLVSNSVSWDIWDHWLYIDKITWNVTGWSRSSETAITAYGSATLTPNTPGLPVISGWTGDLGINMSNLDGAPLTALRTNFHYKEDDLTFYYTGSPQGNGGYFGGDTSTATSYGVEVTDSGAGPANFSFVLYWDTQWNEAKQTNPNEKDTDHDGLTDGEEYFMAHTDPNNPDTDHDGMPDGWEYRYGLNPKDPADVNLDPDQDGLTNLVEYQFDSDPLLADGERNDQGVPVGDGMPDKYEVYQGLAPRRNDSGYMSLYRNGLSRLEQMLSAVIDTDLDGLSNVAEAKLGTNPTAVDSDGDGMPDGWEVMNGFDPNDPTEASADKDLDSHANHYLNGGNPSEFKHTNVQEFDAKTLPYHYDSDNDGLGDRWELMYGTNPLSFCENLVAWYRLEESGEYLWDYSGHNLDGHAYGVTSVAGVTGGSDTQARQFGVISTSQPLENHSYLLVRHDTRLIPDEGITIAFWFKPTQDIPAWESDLVTKAGSYTLTYGTDGKLTYTLITGVTGSTTASTTITSTASLSAAQWNHVALTYDKPTGRQTLYINGTTSSSTLGTPNSPIAIAADTLAAPLLIGSVRKIPCRTPQCSIDDIRIYKGALPPGASSTAPATITDTATIYRLAHPDDPTLEPNRDDWDHDGLSNVDEYRRGTDPQNPDTDGDGLTDGDEVHGIAVTVNDEPRTYYSNPRLTDSDGDGISDKNEIEGRNAAGQLTVYGPTDPGSADTDRDDLFDSEEISIGTNPNKADTDGDGMPDYWELQFQFNPNVANGNEDPDGDGILNAAEYNSNPRTNPLVHNGTNFIVDSDEDGLSDYLETTIYKTDPNNKDTIGDGLGDFFRAIYGLFEYNATTGNLIGAGNPTELQSQNRAGGDRDGDLISNQDEKNASNSAGNPGNTSGNNSGSNPADQNNLTAQALGLFSITAKPSPIKIGAEAPEPTPVSFGSNAVTVNVPEGSCVYLAQSKTADNIHVLEILEVNNVLLSASGSAKGGIDPSDHIGDNPSNVYNFAGAVSITHLLESAPKTGTNSYTFTITRKYKPDFEREPKEPDPEDNPPVDDGGAGNGGGGGGGGWGGGGGGGGAIGWSESEAGDPSASEPEKEDKDKKKNTYSSSAIWVIVKPGVNLEITSLEAISTYLTETKENTPGAYTFKRKDDKSDPPTTKIKLKVHQTGTEGATRKLKWDAKKLVLVGQEGGDGTLELSESDGDKVYELYGHKDLSKDDAQTITLTATASTGFLGTDTAVAKLLPIELKTVTFSGTGCHQIKDIRDSFTNVTSKGYEDSTWTKDEQKGVLYVKESSPTLKIKLGLPANLTITGKIKAEMYQGDSDDIKLTFEKEFSNNGEEIELTTTDKLGDYIDNANLRIKWSVSISNSDWNQFAETTNKLFVIYGTPPEDQPRTYKRLEQICEEAQFRKDPNTIVDGLHRNLAKQFGYDSVPNFYTDTIWVVKDGLMYRCRELSYMLIREMELLGLPNVPQEPYLIYGSTDPIVRYMEKRLSPRVAPSPYDFPIGTEQLLIVDMLRKGGGRDVNRYEACVYYNEIYYPGGFSDPYLTEVGVLQSWLRTSGTVQRWIWDYKGIAIFDEIELRHP